MKKNMAKLFALDVLQASEIAQLLICTTQTLELYAVYQREIFHEEFLAVVSHADENVAKFLGFLKTNKLIHKTDLIQLRKDLLASGDYVQYTLGGDQSLVTNYQKQILDTHAHPFTTTTKETPGLSVQTHDALYTRNIERDLNLLLH